MSLASVALPQQLFTQEQRPDNVSGNWTISANNIDKAGSSLKTVQINPVRFKAGRASVHHTEFITDTREVLTFRGQIHGKYYVWNIRPRGRHADWRAERTN